MTPHLLRNAALVLLVLATSGCHAAQDRWIELRGQRFQVEIADDFESRARGLMFRDQLRPDHGMLFVYEREQPLAFWMKNTRIPLDILFFDQERRLVSILKRVPPCSLGDRCPSYPSRKPAMYALELNAGQADTLELAIGDVIAFDAEIPTVGKP
ncbi:MAG TPA: DUF192 domain-containing protein [Arenimonas sp.]|nr:DUF192 domain-containing protein [Arenimonas sp.]